MRCSDDFALLYCGLKMFPLRWHFMKYTPYLKKELTSRDKQEEVGPSWQLVVSGGLVRHYKLALVAVGVVDPQLGDGDVDGVVARVSAGAGAVLVAFFGRGQLSLGVHEQHLPGLQPATLQVHAKGCGVSAVQQTGQRHRLALLPLQELNITPSWSQIK